MPGIEYLSTNFTNCKAVTDTTAKYAIYLSELCEGIKTKGRQAVRF